MWGLKVTTSLQEHQIPSRETPQGIPNSGSDIFLHDKLHAYSVVLAKSISSGDMYQDLPNNYTMIAVKDIGPI